MTSAYEWIFTTRSFHRTRIELSSAALSLTLTAEQIIWIIQIVRKIVLKKKYTFPDFNNIPAKAEIFKSPAIAKLYPKIDEISEEQNRSVSTLTHLSEETCNGLDIGSCYNILNTVCKW